MVKWRRYGTTTSLFYSSLVPLLTLTLARVVRRFTYSVFWFPYSSLITVGLYISIVSFSAPALMVVIILIQRQKIIIRKRHILYIREFDTLARRVHIANVKKHCLNKWGGKLPTVFISQYTQIAINMSLHCLLCHIFEKHQVVVVILEILVYVQVLFYSFQCQKHISAFLYYSLTFATAIAVGTRTLASK